VEVAQRDFDARMKASLHRARFLDLGLQDDPAAVKPPWILYDPEKEESYDSIMDAFRSCRGRLLLLGDPGAGKTTALLYIAGELLNAADGNVYIPVLVNLSKLRLPRTDDNRTGLSLAGGILRASSEPAGNAAVIEDWLVGEIARPGLDCQ